ncbi:hypothetical protein D3C80_1859280 [compost metagenome]
MEIESGLRTQHAPVVGRRQDGIALIHRYGVFIEAFGSLGEVGIGVDDVAGSADPRRDTLVKAHQIAVDLVRKLHHGGLDNAL